MTDAKVETPVAAPAEEKKEAPPASEKPAEAGAEDDDDEPPELQSAEDASEKGEGEDKKGKQSRTEKKNRKALQKLGMKPVPGVFRVTVRKAKSLLFVINKPDVFKSPVSDTYVIFGEAKIEDPTSSAAQAAAEQFQQAEPAAATAATTTPTEKPAAAASTEASTSSEAVDETGVDPKDIQLVLAQTNVERAKAVAALKKHNGDVVNAIMELTM
eukprot:TRINITY_DN3892_c0_g1_i1.p1 TRINITY_DN3892_c0_g1~~TRINITY_DN3892_c0_g1_i1.p1  ORF type:complete len:229 (+),score=102.13 TRINITY_DN3892_c0_g1_i1:48-689(+)